MRTHTGGERCSIVYLPDMRDNGGWVECGHYFRIAFLAVLVSPIRIVKVVVGQLVDLTV